MDFLQSQTSQNVKKAFMREAAAYMEYYFYGEQAKIDGYQEIYNTYKTICQNEMAHAKIWFKLYHTVFTTKDNLKNSADLEKFEYSKMYSEFSKIARQEGFTDIAKLFDDVGNIEANHEQTFLCLNKQVKNDKVFKRTGKTTWKCLNCGNIVSGKTAPTSCPVCSYPQAYFMEMKQDD